MGRLLAIVSLQGPCPSVLHWISGMCSAKAWHLIHWGHFEMNRGILRTENFSIVGSSALISMKGEIDLASQTQSLKCQGRPGSG